MHYRVGNGNASSIVFLFNKYLPHFTGIQTVININTTNSIYISSIDLANEVNRGLVYFNGYKKLFSSSNNLAIQ